MEKKTTKTTKNSDTMKLAVIGASLAGLAATTYFLFGSKGEKHRKQVKSWALKMRADIVEKLEMARYINEPLYNEIIESVATKYEKGKKASHKEIIDLSKDLKKHWKTISQGAGTVKQDAKKVIQKIKMVKE